MPVEVLEFCTIKELPYNAVFVPTKLAKLLWWTRRVSCHLPFYLKLNEEFKVPVTASGNGGSLNWNSAGNPQKIEDSDEIVEVVFLPPE